MTYGGSIDLRRTWLDPIVSRLWDQWDGGDGASEFGLDQDDPIIGTISSATELMVAFPDERPLTITTANDEGPLLGIPSIQRRWAYPSNFATSSLSAQPWCQPGVHR